MLKGARTKGSYWEMADFTHKKPAFSPVAAELTWLLYLVVIAVLSVAEVLVREELSLLDSLLDILVLVTSLPASSPHVFYSGAQSLKTFSLVLHELLPAGFWNLLSAA